MKNLFRIKIELIQLIVYFATTALMICIADTNDYRIMILCFALLGGCVFSIIAYKPIKEFRKEVLKRW